MRARVPIDDLAGSPFPDDVLWIQRKGLTRKYVSCFFYELKVT